MNARTCMGYFAAALSVLWIGIEGPARAEAPRRAIDPLALHVDAASDLFASWATATLSLRAPGDGYVALVAVDADGYFHVSDPTLSGERAAVHAGRMLRVPVASLTPHRSSARGVTWAFAIYSPVPLLRSGSGRMAAGSVYRASGDPFHAFREYCERMRPAGLDPERLRVSAVRFYVGQWARFPHYLCRVPHRVHSGIACGACRQEQNRYLVLAAEPLRVFSSRSVVSSGYLRLVELSATHRGMGAARVGQAAGSRVDRVISTSGTVESLRRAARARGESGIPAPRSRLDVHHNAADPR